MKINTQLSIYRHQKHAINLNKLAKSIVVSTDWQAKISVRQPFL